jgi:hypothetical protein
MLVSEDVCCTFRRFLMLISGDGILNRKWNTLTVKVNMSCKI